MILIAISDIEKILLDNYSIIAKIQPLAGEADYNYKIVSAENTYLLKICKPEILEEEVQLQVALLDHLNKKEFSFEVPMMMDTLNGKKYFIKKRFSNWKIAFFIYNLFGKVIDPFFVFF